jgi:hypothetical protein
MVHARDPEVERIVSYCEDQIAIAGPQAAQSYQMIRENIRAAHLNADELRAALAVWAADYRRRADELRSKTLAALADQLETSATVFERLLTRMTPCARESADRQEKDAPQTALAWLWQELACRYGEEVANELHAEFKRQGVRYTHARQSLQLGRYTRIRYARHRRFLLSE